MEKDTEKERKINGKKEGVKERRKEGWREGEMARDKKMKEERQRTTTPQFSSAYGNVKTQNERNRCITEIVFANLVA